MEPPTRPRKPFPEKRVPVRFGSVPYFSEESIGNASSEPGPEQLLAAARQGVGEAGGRLLESYRPEWTLLARLEIERRLQGEADSADLVLETVLEAHRDFDQCRGWPDIAAAAACASTALSGSQSAADQTP